MNDATLAVPHNPLIPVRYRILGLLFVVSFVNYLLRNNLSTAQPAIMDEYHFTNTDMSFIYLAFNISYAMFQIPGGVFGDVVGSRRALAIVTISWGVLTALTGFLCLIVTMVVSTHDLNLAARICTEVVLLRGGRIVTHGTWYQ